MTPTKDERCKCNHKPGSVIEVDDIKNPICPDCKKEIVPGNPKVEPLAKVESTGYGFQPIAGEWRGISNCVHENVQANCDRLNAAAFSWSNARVRAALDEAAVIAENLSDKTYWDDPSAGIAAEIFKLKEKYK